MHPLSTSAEHTNFQPDLVVPPLLPCLANLDGTAAAAAAAAFLGTLEAGAEDTPAAVE